MSLLGDGLQIVALLLTAFNILLAVLVVAAIVLMFFLYVTKRQIVIIQEEPTSQQPVGESVHPYHIEISTKSC
jgi:hypothetical protein